MAGERAEPPGAGLELVVVAAGAAAVVAGLVTAGGASLAAWFSDGRVRGGLADWLRVTVRLARGESPSAAWGELATGFPSTGAYWACTAAAIPIGPSLRMSPVSILSALMHSAF